MKVNLHQKCQYYLMLNKFVLTISAVTYSLFIILLPAIIFQVAFNSLFITTSAFIGHVCLIVYLPRYLGCWRYLTWPVRVWYTKILLRFICRASDCYKIGTLYADISNTKTIDDFYKSKKASIRKRMRNILKGVAKENVEVNYTSSNWISFSNLKIQYIHTKRYYPNALLNCLYVASYFFALNGQLTEYKIEGRLVAQGLSIINGNSLIIFIYGSTNDASRSGLWFYNIYDNIQYAISAGMKYVNATGGIHKAEAKRNAGLVSTNDKKLNTDLYGFSVK